METNEKLTVYVVQHKNTRLIHGCFKTKKKAEKYIDGGVDYKILKCGVH